MSMFFSRYCNRVILGVRCNNGFKTLNSIAADIHLRKLQLYSIRNLRIFQDLNKRTLKTRPGLAHETRGGSDMPSKKGKRGKVEAPSETKPSPNINLVVLGTGGPGSQGSIMLCSESSRYLFNCGEGTQRMGAVSRGMRAHSFAKLSGLENIFITHKSWENTGGLLGLAMALEGQKAPNSKSYVSRMQKDTTESSSSYVQFTPRIKLYGPSGVERITMMAKKFSQKTNLEVLRSSEEFQDKDVTITPVVLRATNSEEESGQSSAAGLLSEMEEENSGRELKEPDAKRQRIDDTQSHSPPPREVFAYLCKPKPLRPKINIEKCYEAGVKIGPMVGKLQRGQSVTLEDGTLVHPHQVVDQSNHTDEAFLIVECPSEAYLPSLECSPQLSEYWSPTGDSRLSIIVHFTPVEVFNCDRYQSWIKNFSPTTDHLVLNRQAAETNLKRAREHQALLGLVSPDIFPPLPEVKTSPDVSLLDTDVTKDSMGSDEATVGRTIKACLGLVYAVRGKTRGFFAGEDEVDVKAIEENALSDPDTKTEVNKLRNTLPEHSVDDQDNSRKYPRVVFLGTGSSEPNKIRNQSCIFVELSKNRVAVLDCGEDSSGQIHRFYGGGTARKMLRKINAIFISHMHADHHLGLLNLLKERKRLCDEKGSPFTPLILMAPVQICRWLRFYHDEVEPVMHLFRLLKHQEQLTLMDETFQTATVEDLKTLLNLKEYNPVEVIHCPNAYGVSMTLDNGFKLVYSGDTRPCDKLIEAGKNCDLLIHEATHEDALIKHAMISKHTTFSEAMEVGEKMKAKHVILTHFSQRYPYMVPLEDLDMPPNVGVAFDNMQVEPSTLQYLPKLIPALTAIFTEEIQKLGLKTHKRSREAESMKSNS